MPFIIEMDNDVSCPSCGSTKILPLDHQKTLLQNRTKVACVNCGRSFGIKPGVGRLLKVAKSTRNLE